MIKITIDMDDIKLEGKVAHFPKNSKAVRALKFLDNVKINPNKLWYIIIEDQDSELKTIKYNRNNDLNLVAYTEQLKTYYIQHYMDKALFENIEVVGENDFSIIKNIPKIKLENGQMLISKIAQDLINLLK